MIIYRIHVFFHITFYIVHISHTFFNLLNSYLKERCTIVSGDYKNKMCFAADSMFLWSSQYRLGLSKKRTRALLLRWSLYFCICFDCAFNKFPDFFVQAFKIVIDSWKFSMLLLYILSDNWPIFMISVSNQQLQQQLEYTLLNPDCRTCRISKMQSGREDTWEERYVIKFCYKRGKIPQKRMECFRLHKRFKEGSQSVKEEYGSQYTRVDWPKG